MCLRITERSRVINVKDMPCWVVRIAGDLPNVYHSPIAHTAHYNIWEDHSSGGFKNMLANLDNDMDLFVQNALYSPDALGYHVMLNKAAGVRMLAWIEAINQGSEVCLFEGVANGWVVKGKSDQMSSSFVNGQPAAVVETLRLQCDIAQKGDARDHDDYSAYMHHQVIKTGNMYTGSYHLDKLKNPFPHNSGEWILIELAKGVRFLIKEKGRPDSFLAANNGGVYMNGHVFIAYRQLLKGNAWTKGLKITPIPDQIYDFETRRHHG